MNDTDERWANRCLPLLIGNESGWMLLNSHAFSATWSGGRDAAATSIEFEADDVPAPHPVSSHFGYGIITWVVPYLFRTPPGYNLLARGPSNWPKDGIGALDGVIETDWAVATFTMNWKLTRPGQGVHFDVGEPFCMVVPQRRGELETFSPVVRDIADEPELRDALGRFFTSRDRLYLKHAAGSLPGFEDLATAWEGDYYRGRTVDGGQAAEHQTKLRLAPFDTDDSQSASG